MTEKKADRKKVSFWITETQYHQMKKLAKDRTVSEIIREIIAKELKVSMTQDNMGFIRTQIREELSLLIKPNTDRIMKMLMRIGMMAVTHAFFSGKILSQIEGVAAEDLMYESKKMAAGYLSMRDETLNQAFKEFKQNL
jgi:hypothetical protein